MAQYDFFCKECDESCELSFSMKDDEGRSKAKCPTCDGKVTRIFNIPYAVVKEKFNAAEHTTGPDQHFVDVDGKPIGLNFIDPGDHQEESRAIEEATGMKGVHTDPETGKKCVKVVSNVPDPLGKIDKAKQAGQVETEVKHINQKTKKR